MRKFFVVTALFACSQLHAQTDTLDNVTVTANKHSTKTTETGKVVISINRQQIEKAGSRDLSQIITELGGVFINGYAATPGKEKNIYLRGARVDHTLIAVDGVPVYDASGIGSNFDIRNFPVDLVERVEILKGSQSTLYGSDAIAGVINIITRKGGTKPVAASGVVHYGQYNTLRGNLGLNGAINKLDYNLGFTHFNTTGFSEAERPATASTTFDRDDYTQNGVQANLGWQAASRWRLQPFLRYSSSKGKLDNGAFTDERDFTYNAANLQTGLRNTLSLGRVQLNAVYQFHKTERAYLDDSTQSRNGFYRYAQSAFDATEHFAEAFAVIPWRAFKLTAGADYRSANTDYSATQVSAFSSAKLGRSSDSVNHRQLGLYAALLYSKGAFSAEGGGRFNRHSEYGSNGVFNLNSAYLLRQKLKLFANVSTGYRTPSLYQLFSEYGNRTLRPETALNLEGGAQLLLNGGQSAIRFTFFNRSVSDAIAFLSLPRPPFAQYGNQDEQRDHGVEVDGTWSMGDKFQLKAFYAWVDGSITTRKNNKDTTFFNLYRRPNHTLTLTLGAQLTKAFYVSANANFIGRRIDPTFPPPSFRQVDLRLDAYTLLNLYAEYAFAANRLRIFADVRNVLDQRYSDIYGYNTARFNSYGGVRFRL